MFLIRCCHILVAVASGMTPLLTVWADDRPNILWITSEDNGCELGCYGDSYATTPHLDALAAKSMRYLNAWSNAPVCAPARTAIITGMWPPSLGASHMRSEVRLPAEFRLFPQLLRAAGYYCTNNSKEDYNIIKPDGVWDDSSKTAHWRNRAEGQPFFAVFNSTVSHESQLRTRPHQAVHDPALVPVPGYHPDLPEVRQDWAQYYDQLTVMDTELGKILKELENDGLVDSTIVVYFGDHGNGMPRGKRWLYQSGLHVPLLISIPDRFRALAGERYRHGDTSDELVSFIDLGPTMLSLCGIAVPDYADGRAMLGATAGSPSTYLFGFRDRMDERYDCARAVRDQHYLYIRNFMPHRAQGQFLDYMFQTPSTMAWLTAATSGKTNDAQSLFWQAKPAEELYDLESDPEQLRNLAGKTEHAETQQRLKSELQAWMVAQKDLGLMPEALMKNRAGDAPGQPSPFEMADKTYNAARVWEIADNSTNLSNPLTTSQRYSRAKFPLPRYWGNIGLVYRSLVDPAALQVLQENATTEKNPVVRAVVLEGLARQGDPAQRSAAVESLLDLISNPESSLYHKMMIADCLLASNLTNEEIPRELVLNYTRQQHTPNRYDPYLVGLEETLKKIADNPLLRVPASKNF